MRSYNQYCGVAKALDLIGQRWALLILRDLLLGPRRFKDLLFPGLTPTVLSQRLKGLAEIGLIEHTTTAPPIRTPVWALTKQGEEIEPVIFALGAFGGLFLPGERPLKPTPRWFMTSLQRRYTGSQQLKLQFFVDDIPFKLKLQNRLRVTDGQWHEAHATARGTFQTFVESAAQKEAQHLTITGDQTAVKEFFSHIGDMSQSFCPTM